VSGAAAQTTLNAWASTVDELRTQTLKDLSHWEPLSNAPGCRASVTLDGKDAEAVLVVEPSTGAVAERSVGAVSLMVLFRGSKPLQVSDGGLLQALWDAVREQLVWNALLQETRAGRVQWRQLQGPPANGPGAWRYEATNVTLPGLACYDKVELVVLTRRKLGRPQGLVSIEESAGFALQMKLGEERARDLICAIDPSAWPRPASG